MPRSYDRCLLWLPCPVCQEAPIRIELFHAPRTSDSPEELSATIRDQRCRCLVEEDYELYLYAVEALDRTHGEGVSAPYRDKEED